MSAPCKVRWTYKQAEAAGLTGKPTWKQFRRQMLKARVISEGIRISDPGVVAGLYAPEEEEVQDFDSLPPRVSAQPAPQVVDATVVQKTTEEAVKAEAAKAKAAKVRALVIAIKAAGVPEAERKAWMSIKLNKEVTSSKDLSVEEIDTLLDEAQKAKAEQEVAA
jgi:hypothetical protein